MRFPIKSSVSAKPTNRAEVRNFKVDPKIRVLRFLNLPRLFDLLIHERLFFAPVPTLMKMDPYECSHPIDYDLDNYDRTRLIAQAETLYEFAEPEAIRISMPKDPQKYYNYRVSKMALESLRQLVSSLLLRKHASKVSCNCWHASPGESDAMWRIYCQENGVAIQSTVERLENSLLKPEDYPGQRIQFDLARVKYLKDEERTEEEFYAERPWMIKRDAFSHEQELRLCGKYVEFVPVDLDRLIERIIITPLLPAWAQDAVKSAIEAVFSARGKGKLMTTRSQHMNAPDEVFQLLQMDPEKLRIYRRSLLPPSLAVRIKKRKSSATEPGTT